MRKMAAGLVLFSLLMALSFGVAFAGENTAANETNNTNVTAPLPAVENNTTNITSNETIVAVGNATETK